MASLLIPGPLARDVTAEAQGLGVAVMVSGEARDAARAGADGIQVDADAVADARTSIGKDRFVGAFAGASRHAAMEAAEAGADYIAFDQNGASVGGEPIIRWWADMMEIPCVAFTPVELNKLDTLLPQKPDFIRPSDAMWSDAAAATRIVSELTARLSAQ